jgi:hypothetical protein
MTLTFIPAPKPENFAEFIMFVYTMELEEVYSFTDFYFKSISFERHIDGQFYWILERNPAVTGLVGLFIFPMHKDKRLRTFESFENARANLLCSCRHVFNNKTETIKEHADIPAAVRHIIEMELTNVEE